jgi:hypothetical protein
MPNKRMHPTALRAAGDAGRYERGQEKRGTQRKEGQRLFMSYANDLDNGR